MFSEDTGQEPLDALEGASQALAAPNTAATLRNAVAIWAEQTTRPETLARAAHLKSIR